MTRQKAPQIPWWWQVASVVLTVVIIIVLVRWLGPVGLFPAMALVFLKGYIEHGIEDRWRR